MTFLDEVRAKRQKLADVLFDEEYSGIRKIVEDLYPDRAHFIYELLQNAEDVGATEAAFRLTSEMVSFEHNGRPFNENDVLGITNLGKGTKEDQEDQIGRFGIGFKAVFAYTETPHIWSKTYSFKISSLVLPTAIPRKSHLGRKTRFEFPFNNPKKPARTAYEEVQAGLEGLVETTLLFLSHLESVCWQIGDVFTGGVRRIEHSENHYEAIQWRDDTPQVSSHFLRFSAPVDSLPKQNVSIAFDLDLLPQVTAFNPQEALAKQLRIVSSNPGRVAVFFPAEKEISGLRFHLHAPFVPELSRASIRETPANIPLYHQLARLTAKSLHAIRDLKLLSGEFLGVLPNPQDSMPARYQPIRTAIIEAMKNEPLTPTHARSYAPAKYLLQAKASLKELVSADDLRFLLPERKQSQWVIGATQTNSNQDRFLEGLGIVQWDIDSFTSLLLEKTAERHYSRQDGPDKDCMNWLASKGVEWHQQLYSVLYRGLPEHEWLRQHSLDYLKRVQIVRLGDGTYSTGHKCYFPTDGVDHDKMLPRVDRMVYTSGKSKTQQTEAKRLLEGIGVREVGDAEQVHSVLRQRYTKEADKPDDELYLKDLERFISLIKREPEQGRLFSEFCIFKRICGDWATPEQVFLDSPYLDTGLTAYYQLLGDTTTKAALSEWYQSASLSKEQFRKFAQALDVTYELRIDEVKCKWNNKKDYLYGAAGARVSTNEVDRDYIIPYLHKVIEAKDIGISRLIWGTMCRDSHGKLTAEYRKSFSGETRTAPSLLVNWLQSRAWVPQSNGDFVRPSETSRTLLPKGFPLDEGYEWLKAVRFGENERQRSEEHKKRQTTARELGFPDEGSLRDAQWFAKLAPEERQRLKDDSEHRLKTELPEHRPHNPDRRAERIAQEAADALERISEKRLRAVSIGREEVKIETDPYLREQYKTPEGEMICQICQDRLPFKLDDGSFYFEKVEFLPELQSRHYQNYLALCPNHGAMYQYANGSRDQMKERFMAVHGNELEIILAQQSVKVYFTKTHIADLKTVIEVDEKVNVGEAEA